METSLIQLDFNFGFGADKGTQRGLGHTAGGGVNKNDAVVCHHTYSVRVSNRARSVSLRVLPGIGLEVTIPRRFSRARIPDIIQEHAQWINKSMAEMARLQDPVAAQWPPVVLDLKATGQTLDIHFEPTTRTTENYYTACIDGSTLRLQGPDCDRHAVSAVIEKLLKRMAKDFLAPLVRQHADRHGIAYKKLVVRGQKTLWGSYSSSGTLSLNYKLLFLAPELVQYVILHELAHVRHMNHSAAFWSHLENMQPGARELDRGLNIAAKKVPLWLEKRR